MRKRGLYCRPVFVCLSVCPSVTLVYCTEDIIKLLSPPGIPISLVFDLHGDTDPLPGFQNHGIFEVEYLLGTELL